MNIIHRRAKLDDLKEIVSLLADDKLGRMREQEGSEVAQEYLDAFAKIDSDPNQYLMILENDAEGPCCINQKLKKLCPLQPFFRLKHILAFLDASFYSLLCIV